MAASVSLNERLGAFEIEANANFFETRPVHGVAQAFLVFGIE
jgi:hypothetical protein